jgi:hypothetical protein
MLLTAPAFAQKPAKKYPTSVITQKITDSTVSTRRLHFQTGRHALFSRVKLNGEYELRLEEGKHDEDQWQNILAPHARVRCLERNAADASLLRENRREK